MWQPNTVPGTGLHSLVHLSTSSCGSVRARGDAEACYQGNPKRRRVHFYLNFKRTHKFKSFRERLLGELWIFGELLFDNATPVRMYGHAPWFTAAYVLARPSSCDRVISA